MSTSFPHQPVLLQEVLAAFEDRQITTFVDGTLGAGGHAQSILEAHPEIIRYVGIDQDQNALAIASARLQPWKKTLVIQQGNFADIDRFLKERNITHVDGILVDLGVSSMQIDQAERGFSFSREGPLDMRMDPTSTLTASDIVNTWTEQELARVFRDYGEERKWRLAAHTIVLARSQKSIQTTSDLVAILKPIFPWNPKRGINPLTLIFQGLRICVNRELERLELFLPKAVDLLSPGGRLAVISFHSLEDRIVKNHFRLAASDKWETSGLGTGLFRDKKPTVELITKKPIIPSDEEIDQNPRSRSAKLRVIEKLE